MIAILAYLRARLSALRAPTAGEVAGALFVVGLVAWAHHRGQQDAPGAVQEVRGPTRVDTVTVERVKAQEPPAAPGLIHRAAYRDVQPERVQVAPGAGADVLAAVCDTSKGAAAPAVSRDGGEAPSPPSAPAVVYAWKLADGWTPWSAHRLELDEVSRDGQRIVSLRVHAPAEGRTLPAEVTREARLWRRVLKPLPFVAAVAAGGYVAGRLTR